MPPRSLVAPLCVVVCLVLSNSASGQEAAGGQSPLDRLTEGRATEILEDSSELADAVVRQIKSLRDPAETMVVENIQDVLTPATEWRWYSRDHGLLLAIPVTQRVGTVTAVDAEKVFADVVRRLINQRGWGNPRVQVVFIEPRLPPPMARSIFHVRPCPIVATCECACQ